MFWFWCVWELSPPGSGLGWKVPSASSLAQPSAGLVHVDTCISCFQTISAQDI